MRYQIMDMMLNLISVYLIGIIGTWILVTVAKRVRQSLREIRVEFLDRNDPTLPQERE